jgi:hypothetical protein
MSYRSIILLVAATLNLVIQQGWLGGIASPLAPAVTTVTYVYEQRETKVPSAVLAALDRINRELKIRATTFDVDTKDGDEQVPDQYKLPLTAAEAAGLPVLVVVGGDKVLRTVKDPKTADAVWEAAQ